MRRVTGPILTLVAAVVLASLGAAEEKKDDKKETGKAHVVLMKDNKFEVKDSKDKDKTKLVVTVGDTVVWENAGDNPHTATSVKDADKDLAFDTGEVESGKKSKAVEFKKAGTVKYFCKVHGMTMSGTIEVKEKK